MGIDRRPWGQALEGARWVWCLTWVLVAAVGACSDSGSTATSASSSGGPCDVPGCTPPTCEGVTCGGHGACGEVAGGVACTCDPGYHADGVDCVLDSTTSPCDGVDCGDFASCTADSGMPVCSCNPGYDKQGDACVISCDQTIAPGDDVAAAVSAAAAGSSLCLGAGDYGEVTLEGIVKTSSVVLQSVSAQDASLGLVVRDSDGLTFQSLTIGGLDLAGKSTKNITVRSSTFTGQAVLNMTDCVDANVVIDGSSFDAISVCQDCYEGRLQILQNPQGTQAIGVTISNNHFGGPGESDGIQIGAYGAVIGPGNVFDGIVQANYQRHVDAIQLYGQSHTTITGNYFVNNDVQIMAPDGGDTETITHNVFVGGDYRPSIQLGSHTDDTFVHNTVLNVSVHIDKKQENPDKSQNAAVHDNVMVDSDFGTVDSGGTESCDNCTFDTNLFSSAGDARGTNTVVGVPTFMGGAAPADWAGFRLTAASLGYKGATDGANLGTNVFP